MVALSDYLKLTRPLNLLIVALLQGMMYYGVLLPVLEENGIDSVFKGGLFPVFILVTVIIAASGNVINDIIDIGIDKINKPSKWIAGNTIPLRSVGYFYIALIITGWILSIYIAFKIDKFYYLFLYALAVIFLFFYSKKLKKVLLLGNLLVSIFTAGVIGIILVFEYNSGIVLKGLSDESYKYIKSVFYGFMFFSFMTSMYREIVKDIEDMYGDNKEGAKTIPLVFGVKASKIISLVIAVIILFALVLWTKMDINTGRDYFILYTYIIVIPFLLFTVFMLLKAKAKKDFGKLSWLIKIFMLLGILLLVFYLKT